MSIDSLAAPHDFSRRHIGPRPDQIREMLELVGAPSLDALAAQTVPAAIRIAQPLNLPGLPAAKAEHEMLAELRELAAQNKLWKSYLGLGYSDTITPPVIQRNILENPGWYTQYTPYQAEISQGRLEMLLSWQTMITDLTGLEIANASLLDEGTAAAEAMTLAHREAAKKAKSEAFFVAENCHPQTISVVMTRAEPLDIQVIVGNPHSFDPSATPVFGALVQYPDTFGVAEDYRAFCARVHDAKGLVCAASDLLALTMLTPPGEWGADICIGNSQRFGVPLGYGGPHAAFFATKEAFKRGMAGRLIGVSEDSRGKRALRMALQTREQHIRREKATSNICTAQVLLAICAVSYAMWHGPAGLKAIARRVRNFTVGLADGLEKLGLKPMSRNFFDTLRVEVERDQRAKIIEQCEARRINLRKIDDTGIGIALDECTTAADVKDLLAAIAGAIGKTAPDADALIKAAKPDVDAAFARTSDFLTHPVFHSYHAEHDLLRYLKRMEARDLSLTHSMIALGSCTMKLNAAAEMICLTQPGFGKIHPFAPRSQAPGYTELIKRLEAWLCEITGFAAFSMQPNSGAQGEYAGLLVIRAFHRQHGNEHRDVCLIPSSAHGTNPASAVMCGMNVVVVKCEENGNIDVEDLKAKATQHKDKLAALMVTYPSTHGVFEPGIKDICKTIHDNGGQVYMDGANMNAQVGLCRPADIGADVCHLNLHKTFCIPHGGGGPGMGPIGVAPHLAPFLPAHPLVSGVGGEYAIGPVSAAPFGSASILTISYAYIGMMGGEGLTQATKVAILNANYMAKRLETAYVTIKAKKKPAAASAGRGNTAILFAGAGGRVAHEFILDLRPFEETAHVTA
ncbi:MAG: aminomethyl-transferring glycine dehydrogenase, partial [Planctomycetota bacterium]